MRVFPTRVGVDRRRPGISARADEFSPHAWGWTYRASPGFLSHKVFPTRVGVDLVQPPPLQQALGFPHTRGGGPPAMMPRLTSGASFPHTRGGGPQKSRCRPTGQRFSPHAWGWTGWGHTNARPIRVFPTRVGVDRKAKRKVIVAGRFPHTRGGGPHVLGAGRVIPAFSPHAWGWTAGVRSHHRPVLCFPHTRGGGPMTTHNISISVVFSPHAWGWTESADFARSQANVFPTRVGVDLRAVQAARISKSFPHTRGGGPYCTPRYIPLAPFSPHAWGWTK